MSLTNNEIIFVANALDHYIKSNFVGKHQANLDELSKLLELRKTITTKLAALAAQNTPAEKANA